MIMIMIIIKDASKRVFFLNEELRKINLNVASSNPQVVVYGFFGIMVCYPCVILYYIPPFSLPIPPPKYYRLIFILAMRIHLGIV